MISAALVAASASFGSVCASAAPRTATSNDLIVRYRDPQNDLAQAMDTALASAAGAARKVEIVNASEGVLKLKFDHAAQAEAARARLELSPQVVSVAPDYLYRPAIHYAIREAAQQAHDTFVAPTFLSAPFVVAPGALARDNPDVQLPPTDVVVGADPLVAKDWAMSKIDMPQNLSERTLSTVVAAVIDTGIDYNHEDLSGALWRDPSNPRIVGRDFAHDTDKPYDIVHFDIDGCLKDFGCQLGIDQGKYLTNPGHGTHCAGHVGAVANNSLGIRGVGAGPTKVMGLKFFFDQDDPNAGSGDDAAAIKAIDYAIAHGAKVISASWGGEMSASEADKSELKAALQRAQKAGLIVVVAAGNGDSSGNGYDLDSADKPVYPAAYGFDNMIVVAATDSSDKLGTFSNYGAKGVQIGAPGVKILSTISGGGYNDIVAKFSVNGKQNELAWDGTSMATPIVAGAVSLVWAKYPDEDYHQIRDRILSSARKVQALAGKVSTGGVLDVAAALR
jgi:subtilisin family serine protease